MKGILLLALIPAACFAGVVQTFDAPDTGITGLAWGDGVLWAVDGTTQYIYGINPSDGSVTTSFYVTDQTSTYDPVAGGLAYGNNTIYLAMHSGTAYGKMYKFNTAGSYLGEFDVYC
jgi:hypothetical protein